MKHFLLIPLALLVAAGFAEAVSFGKDYDKYTVNFYADGQ